MPRVEILDTTLRDGAQGEGISLSIADKFSIVATLDELGVDYIEAGNPGSNPKDLEFFSQTRALSLKNSKLAAFGATRKKNVAPKDDEGLRSLLSAGTEDIVIFGKSWTLHVEEVLKATLEENIAMIRETVEYLRAQGRKVIYDAEHFFDGYNADPGYTLRCLEAAHKAGAAVLVLCDTNGGNLPSVIAQVTSKVVAEFGCAVGIHPHNDSGLAVANCLEAVQAGASHVQGTLVGFGERCGNANLSTVIPDLVFKLKKDCLVPGSMASLFASSRRVAEIANVSLDEGSPYIGLRAFSHKAGMHVDALTKITRSYEHVSPDLVGNSRRFLASEVGGRAVALEMVKRIDPSVSRDAPAVAEVARTLKEMEKYGYQFEGADASIAIIVRKALGLYQSFFTLGHYRLLDEQPVEDKRQHAQAIVKVFVGDKEAICAAEGDGPVNALDLALRKALEGFYPEVSTMRLSDYKVRVLNSQTATAAMVRVLIESTDGKNAWTTVGVSTDIIEASWIALADSIDYKLHMIDNSTFKAAEGRTIII